MAAPLWTPSEGRIANSNLTAFMNRVCSQRAVSIPDYGALYQWSIDEPQKFWKSVWDFGGIIAQRRGRVVLRNGDKMPGAQWFPEARLNFAQNLLRRHDDSAAIIFWSEDRIRRVLSHRELVEQVARLAQAMRAAGVSRGDRVAAYLPNMPETVIAMLATAAVGAVWSSCSPDFGAQGVLDRFGQIEPKILLGADGYYYNGKTHDSLVKLRAIVDGLPSLVQTVVVPYVSAEPLLSGIRRSVYLRDFVAGHETSEIEFESLPFDHPLYIMYSSGTTGVPKCIVHGAGGTLIQHLKEHLLHVDLKPGDRLFYFTTCGWMMWNWLASCLASEATVICYDGAPFHPDPNALFDLAAAERVTHFGTSAKFIDSCAKAGVRPGRSHDLGALRAVLSTGSPLAPESFEYVYRDWKADLCLSSISGGTDIIGCFVAGNPIGPVWPGEIQKRALGLDVAVFDENGRPLVGEPGELVCLNAHPSMPVAFWNDPDGAKYHDAYFARYPGVWCHGDWVELTSHGGLVVHGRSDATLNPGGVRIGTAEIYRQVEQLDEVLESLVVGQDWRNDVRLVLFVRLAEGVTLDDALKARIRKQIRDNTSPRHVPAKILSVADIPRTLSGKIVELAVRDVIHGRPVRNRDALANPEALALYADLADLAD